MHTYKCIHANQHLRRSRPLRSAKRARRARRPRNSRRSRRARFRRRLRRSRNPDAQENLSAAVETLVRRLWHKTRKTPKTLKTFQTRNTPKTLKTPKSSRRTREIVGGCRNTGPETLAHVYTYTHIYIYMYIYKCIRTNAYMPTNICISDARVMKKSYACHIRVRGCKMSSTTARPETTAMYFNIRRIQATTAFQLH